MEYILTLMLAFLIAAIKARKTRAFFTEWDERSTWVAIHTK